jgi:hypothetical protein
MLYDCPPVRTTFENDEFSSENEIPDEMVSKSSANEYVNLGMNEVLKMQFKKRTLYFN